MGDEQLTTFQAAQLRWLKQQVDNLQDERYRKDARPNIQRELFAAREELDNYVQALRDGGYKI
jgi:biotin operon repressor